MSIKLFDTAKQEVVPFEPPHVVSMYTCGITPYDATHIGHAATFMAYDVLQRRLMDLGHEVRCVRNVTDVDDPLFAKARDLGVHYLDLAAGEEARFERDMEALNALPVYSTPRASSAIADIRGFIGMVLERGYAYVVGGSVYFDVSKSPNFGTISHYDRQKMLDLARERGGDVDNPNKRDPLDFVLWHPSASDEPSWEAVWGAGRPGWHIECSAIALAYLKPDPADDYAIDIQGGGSDLIFPHHEMGAAQVAIMTGKPYAQTYVHTGMVGLDGEKMSKSKGNLVFVSKLVAAGIDPMVIRLALLSAAYGRDRMWTDQVLAEANARMSRLQSALSRNEVAPTKECIALIIASLADNLDTVRAIKAIDTWIEQTECGLTGGSSGELSRALDTFLGIAI